MTVVQYGQGRFSGLAADTKPATAIAFALFTETDTGKVFYTVNNGTAWTQITAGSLTGTGGALTLPAGPDTLLGRATTDSVTGKTMNANANTFQNLKPSSIIKKTGDWYGRGTASIINGDGILTGINSHITVGTATHTSTFDTTGVYDHVSTGTTANSIGGTKGSGFSIRGLNVAFSCRFNLVQVTASRCYVGLHSNGGTNPASSGDVLNTFGGVGLWFDSAVSANWKIVFNNAGGSNSTDTTIAAAAGIHTLNIVAVDGSTKFTFELTGGTDAIALQDVTGDIPAQTTALGYYAYVENLTTTASLMDIYAVHVESDK